MIDVAAMYSRKAKRITAASRPEVILVADIDNVVPIPPSSSAQDASTLKTTVATKSPCLSATALVVAAIVATLKLLTPEPLDVEYTSYQKRTDKPRNFRNMFTIRSKKLWRQR